MKLDFISVIDANVFGVKEPTFAMNGSVKRDVGDYHFVVEADHQVVDFDILEKLNGPLNDFHIICNIPKENKIVEVFFVVNGERTLICTRKNTFSKRFKSKLRTMTIFTKIKKIKDILYRLLQAVYKGIRLAWKEHHFLIPPVMWKKYYHKLKDKLRYVKNGNGLLNPLTPNDYNKWLNHYEKFDTQKIVFEYNPLISVVIPIYNIERVYLKECLDSILNQSYQNFEICLADDCSTKQETLDTLKEYEEKDARIKVCYRKENGHISKATNSALELATGEFIALMDNDDILALDALYENVKVLNDDPETDMIYSDEDKVDMSGVRRDPNFKPNFSPDTFLSCNYICHFTIMRKSILDKIGGYRVGYEGAQDYDLFLRFTEQTDKIYHISKLLYRWRMIPGSTAATIDSKGYAVERGRLALEDAMKRRNILASVKNHHKVPLYCIDYQLEKEPSVSIIIPTKDLPEILDTCLKSVFNKTLYKNYEVIVVNNNSEKAATYDLFSKYKQEYVNFRVVDANIEFNYSKINNIAIKESTAEYVILLNNDTEIITEDWMRIMVSYASQSHIGAVGAKLLYPDSTVQHGGIIAGLGGVASHYGMMESRTSLGIYGRLCVPHNYSAVTAACLAIKRSKYDEVGGLDNGFAVSYNDVDLNFKLLQSGYYNVLLPQVEIYHHESKSRGLPTSGPKYRQFLDEQKRMYEKWADIIADDPFYNINCSRKGAYMLDPITDKNQSE